MTHPKTRFSKRPKHTRRNKLGNSGIVKRNKDGIVFMSRVKMEEHRMPLPHAQELAADLKNRILSKIKNTSVEICGEVRRNCDTVGSLSFVVRVPSNEEATLKVSSQVKKSTLSLRGVFRSTGSPARLLTKVRLKKKDAKNDGISCSVLFAEDWHMVAAVVWATADSSFRTRLNHLASQKGLLFNQNGLFPRELRFQKTWQFTKDQQAVSFNSESKLLDFLGVTCSPDHWEGSHDPKVGSLNRVSCLWQRSAPHNILLNQAQDHVSQGGKQLVLIHPLRKEDGFRSCQRQETTFFASLSKLQADLPQLQILSAVESSIGLDGMLDATAATQNRFDHVLGTLRHQPRQKPAERLKSAMRKNPKMVGITRPTNRHFGHSNRNIETRSWKSLFNVSVQTHTFWMIGGDPTRLDMPPDLVTQGSNQTGVLFGLMGDPDCATKWSLKMAHKAGLSHKKLWRPQHSRRRQRKHLETGISFSKAVTLPVLPPPRQDPPQRTPRFLAIQAVQQAVNHLHTLSGVERVLPCGSIRRGRDTVKDLDIVVQVNPDNRAEVADQIRMMGDSKVGSKATKRIIVTVPLPNTDQTIDLDFWLVEAWHWGAAIFHATGSGEFNRRLRARLTKRHRGKFKLNEYGIFHKSCKEFSAKKQQLGVGLTEESIFKALDLPWRDPVARNDHASIDRPGPALVSTKDIQGDWHWIKPSDLKQVNWHRTRAAVKQAQDQGLQHVCLTLALNASTPKRTMFRNKAKLLAMCESFKQTFSIKVMSALEVQICEDGSLHAPASLLKGVDFSLGAMSQTQVNPTRSWIRAVRSGKLHGIVPRLEDNTQWGSVLKEAQRTDTFLGVFASKLVCGSPDNLVQEAAVQHVNVSLLSSSRGSMSLSGRTRALDLARYNELTHLWKAPDWSSFGPSLNSAMEYPRRVSL